MITQPATTVRLHPRDRDSREMRTLLSRAARAFRQGRAAAAPPPGTGPTEGQLNNAMLAYMYGRLNTLDTTNLAKIGGVRQNALELAREGRLDEAEAAIKLARFFLSVAGFSPLGRAAADTLHHAAESYLSYRRGDFDDAGARMVASVAATDRLADEWGESLFTTARRAHLLHNLMKVEARRGASRQAVLLGARILAHLTGAPVQPGVPALTRPAATLEPVIAADFCDAVAATLAEVLAKVADAEAKELMGLLAGLAPSDAAMGARVWGWLPLKFAALAGDPRHLLETAAPFLRAGRGRARVLWYAAALDVVRVARRLDPNAALQPAVAQMEADLGTEPGVPTWIQAAAGSRL